MKHFRKDNLSIKKSIDQSVLCWLATVSKDNVPNVSPKEIFTYFEEDKIILANIASPQTVKNIKQQENVVLYEVPVKVSREGHDVADMYPARSKYPTSSDLLNEIAVAGNLWRDIYIVIRDFDRDSGKRATLQININPTVRFVWLATFIMVEQEAGGFKVSFRSRGPTDCSKVAEHFGGGGHKAAAGAFINEGSLELSRQQILAVLTAAIDG